MKTKAPATIEDLYNVLGKAELIDGEIVLMSPTGYSPARAAYRILLSLGAYEDEAGLGVTLPDNTGFIVNLPRRRSFSPDASFFTGHVKSGVNLKFIEGAPVFAVEVRSEGDYGPAAKRKMAAKRADYFAAGTQVVWDIDLRGGDVVRAYHANSPDNPTIYRRGEIADAEPALPGWSMPVDALFS